MCSRWRGWLETHIGSSQREPEPGLVASDLKRSWWLSAWLCGGNSGHVGSVVNAGRPVSRGGRRCREDEAVWAKPPRVALRVGSTVPLLTPGDRWASGKLQGMPRIPALGPRRAPYRVFTGILCLGSETSVQCLWRSIMGLLASYRAGHVLHQLHPPLGSEGGACGDLSDAAFAD